MIVATGEAPKRSYGEREVIARRCKKCGTRGRVYGRDRDRGGRVRSSDRYVMCPNKTCNEKWTQRPAD